MAVKKKKKRRPDMQRKQTGEMTREEAKRYHARQRKKVLLRRRRMFLGATAVLLLLIVLLIMRGCGAFEHKAKETTLTLQSDGTIIFEEVADIGDASFSDLKSYVKSEIKTYNKKAGEKKIKLLRIKKHGEEAYVRTSYQDAATYADFTGLSLYVGTVEGALSEGISLSDVYVKVTDGAKGKTVDTDKLLSHPKAKVLVVEQEIAVSFDGLTVTYVTDGATEISGDTVNISVEESEAIPTTVIFYKAKE